MTAKTINQKIPVTVIIGPTGCGKTARAIELALKNNGEIISCDSMQIYRGMDIGTAKPTKEELKAVSHHLIDIADITDSFSVSEFIKLAKNAVIDIYSRNKHPIIAGGTGLYVDMLINGISLPEMEIDLELRSSLFKKAENEGQDAIHNMLKEIDPEEAEKIHPHNIKRVIRAIEIYRLTGKTKTQHNAESRLNQNIFFPDIIYLKPDDRIQLYQNTDNRVDQMFKNGLEEEVFFLYKKGLKNTPTASQAIGYKEFYPYFEREYGLEQVKFLIKKNTRHYAKRQYTYFNNMKKE